MAAEMTVTFSAPAPAQSRSLGPSSLDIASDGAGEGRRPLPTCWKIHPLVSFAETLSLTDMRTSHKSSGTPREASRPQSNSRWFGPPFTFGKPLVFQRPPPPPERAYLSSFPCAHTCCSVGARHFQASDFTSQIHSCRATAPRRTPAHATPGDSCSKKGTTHAGRRQGH